MASNSDYHDIPLIDFKPFLHGSFDDREHVAASIDAGLKSTGFIYLKNHGVDLGRVQECFNWSERFFALPDSEKKLLQRSTNQSQNRGYSGVGKQKVREQICMKETFTCGNPKDDTKPNIWPPEDLLPGFRKCMEDLFKECARLIHQLLDCLSVALKLSSAESLSGFHAKCRFSFDLLHYPALSRSSKLSRMPAHSDTGTLTLLFQDNIGGLEIADLESASTEKSAEFEKCGKFKYIKPVPDTVIVNVGYLLMRWSNGRWRNTIHRVVEPPLLLQGTSSTLVNESDISGDTGLDSGTANEISPARYSIPFSASPDPETIVQALSGCWSEEVPRRWNPMNADNYLRRKREGMYV